MSKKLIFSIGTVLFSYYGINVETCLGLLNIPKRKSRMSNDDIKSHGKYYDISTPAKFDERIITLNCFIVGTSRLDLFTKINQFKTIFDAAGYHRLTAEIDTDIKLPFEVIRVEGETIEPKWEVLNKTIARFKLKLVEPQPVKRVISANGGNVTIAFNCTKYVTIGWGNGTYDYDLLGGIRITKNLSIGTQIVIMGDIEEITGFTLTGGTTQWDIWS